MTNPTVLIVEDEAPLDAMLRYNLEKEGFQVCKAGDGEEELAEIAARKPDIVLLDWMLPLVSNIEVCREIRRSPKVRPMPVRTRPGHAKGAVDLARVYRPARADQHRVFRETSPTEQSNGLHEFHGGGVQPHSCLARRDVGACVRCDAFGRSSYEKDSATRCLTIMNGLLSNSSQKSVGLQERESESEAQVGLTRCYRGRPLFAI